MRNFSRLKNRLIAKVSTAFSFVGKMLTALYRPAEQQGKVPWTPAVKRLRECSVSIVTTAGVHRKDQKPFDMNDPAGDPSLRIIEGRVSVDELMITHDYYDHRDADRDINIVFPIERLWEFAKDGLIKSVAGVHFSFMGHIVGQHIETLTGVTAPEAAWRLRSEGVDIVLLTPGWGICNQTVGLIQREIEGAGIPTIGISIVREYTEKVKPPRTVFLGWPFGHPLGEPFNIPQQQAVLIEAFRNLYSIDVPGTIVELPFRWRREVYDRYHGDDLRAL